MTGSTTILPRYSTAPPLHYCEETGSQSPTHVYAPEREMGSGDDKIGKQFMFVCLIVVILFSKISSRSNTGKCSSLNHSLSSIFEVILVTVRE